jgi:GNAT superfamily N-acetyltransferase
MPRQMVEILTGFMVKTYQEVYPQGRFEHLPQTVAQFFSSDTPVWWIETVENRQGEGGRQPVACIWLGNAIDQVYGDRCAHVLLLYVEPNHRRQGLATALMTTASAWATHRGDRQLGLQVFGVSEAAMQLYQKLGYQTQSLWMVKAL